MAYIKAGDILQEQRLSYSIYYVATGINHTLRESDGIVTEHEVYAVRMADPCLVYKTWIRENDNIFRRNSHDEFSTPLMTTNILDNCEKTKMWYGSTEEFATFCRYGKRMQIYNVGVPVAVSYLKENYNPVADAVAKMLEMKKRVRREEQPRGWFDRFFGWFFKSSTQRNASDIDRV